MEFSNPFPGLKPGEKPSKQDILSAIRLSIAAEHDATALYDKIAEVCGDEKIAKVMRDVADEEQVHVGEFTKLLEMYESDEEEKTEEGEEEVEEMAEESIQRIANSIEDI
jgi:rubrerythrin